MSRKKLWITLMCASLLAACGGGLKLSILKAAYRRPSNVAVFFTVDTSSGEPVTTLLSNDFRIYEDGVLVSVHESRQTIISPKIAAEHYALLLIDMSASVAESDQISQVVEAASEFVAKVEEYQKVAVFAFDGSRRIHQIMPFTPSDKAASHHLSLLSEFRTRDPSTNLHGAIIQAVAKLDSALKKSSAPLRFGTIVVFTDGTDRAFRVTYEDMLKTLEKTEHSLFAIGVGNEIDDATLQQIGRDSFIRVEDRSALSMAFEQIGSRIVDLTRRYYLLSYCSPSRAGKHDVTIEAVADNSSGEVTYSFNATGFGPGCDASKPPPFDTSGRDLYRKQIKTDKKTTTAQK